MIRLGFRLILRSWLWLLLPALSAAEPALILSTNDPTTAAIAQNFQESFGQGIAVYQLAGNQSEQQRVGEKLAAAPPNLVVVIGNAAAQLAKRYLPGVPTVYCAARRPELYGLSGPNVFGVFSEPDPKQQLESLQNAFPAAKSIGLIYSPKYSQGHVDQVKKLLGPGRELKAMPVDSIKDVPGALRTVLEQVQVLWLIGDPMVITSDSFPYIVLSALQKGVPLFGSDEAMAHGGAAVSLIPDPADVGKQAARLAQGLLASKPPASSLAYAQGQVAVNKKILTLLNLSLPPEFLKQVGRSFD